MNNNKKKTKFRTNHPKFRTRFIKFISEVMSWISKVYTFRVPRPYEAYIPLLLVLDRVLHTRGNLGLIDYVKRLRLAFHRFLSQEPLKNPGVKCTRDGLPIVLRPLVSFDESKLVVPASLPLLETILYCTRALNTDYSFSGESIEQPAKQQVPSSFGKHAKKFWRTLGSYPSRRVPRYLRWTQYHFTTKSGPNGHALGKCLRDLAALPQDLLHDLWVVGGKEFAECTRSLLKGWSLLPDFLKGSKEEKAIFRKLVAFPDKEGKTREVAILDYFSQTALRPLHTFLFRILKRIRQDCTFNQGGFRDLIGRAEVFYSFDLTAATDRFPIAVIKMVLESRLPKHYVDSWARIMSDWPFWMPDVSRYIKYQVGNPMGAYSSWASFAVAHHYVVFYCCEELGRKWTDLPYALLGDDIVIGDKEVAELYRRVMVDILGVEISPTKTFTSPIFFEFAKRRFLRGEEITHFPISSLKESSSRYYLMVNSLSEAEDRGWIPGDGVPLAVSEYYSLVKRFRSKRVKDLYKKSYICERVMKMTRGASPGTELNALCAFFGLPITEMSDEGSNVFITNICRDLYTEALGKMTAPGGEPLGDLATNLVMYFTSFADSSDEMRALESLYSLPHTRTYGVMEEMYMDSLRSRPMFEEFISAKAALALRVIAVPQSDEVFTMRTSKVVALASTVVGKRLERELYALMST